jgi:hypothetical protein
MLLKPIGFDNDNFAPPPVLADIGRTAGGCVGPGHRSAEGARNMADFLGCDLDLGV